jgi:hypothetical protein
MMVLEGLGSAVQLVRHIGLSKLIFKTDYSQIVICGTQGSIAELFCVYVKTELNMAAHVIARICICRATGL